MTDVHTPEQRRRNMAAIRNRDTGPELAVRRLVHRMGFRYVLGGRQLPGTPDLVFPSRRKVIFVNGCFWHMHACKNGRVVPATRTEFWQTKRLRTVERDRACRRDLVRLGYAVCTVWECKISKPGALSKRLRQFLAS